MVTKVKVPGTTSGQFHPANREVDKRLTKRFFEREPLKGEK
jgi:hypothetical protein